MDKTVAGTLVIDIMHNTSLAPPAARQREIRRSGSCQLELTDIGTSGFMAFKQTKQPRWCRGTGPDSAAERAQHQKTQPRVVRFPGGIAKDNNGR
eukprot:CAMPEP_0184390680 /NCGR_PEP_ID=MMETSP0007-20130409/13494_1 /TAXON_ID=97485 /ORGANISM="Prymnesium parvum, Strain Texoma1" /LENGTH=94 /DNA_ID=CAMNT_0026740503 /DNA_START=72 /DNA_END=356 /DNA_ORIENTATION=-